jgi:hypothetical protein
MAIEAAFGHGSKDWERGGMKIGSGKQLRQNTVHLNEQTAIGMGEYCMER